MRSTPASRCSRSRRSCSLRPSTASCTGSTSSSEAAARTEALRPGPGARDRIALNIRDIRMRTRWASKTAVALLALSLSAGAPLDRSEALTSCSGPFLRSAVAVGPKAALFPVYSAAVGDFNEEGNVDILVPGLSSLTVFRGTVPGIFLPGAAVPVSVAFFVNATAATEIYTLSLHDAANAHV